MTNRLESMKEIYICELVAHSEGKFSVSEKKYRPEWPRGSPEEINMAKKMVHTGIEAVRNYYQRQNKHPSPTRVERHPDSTIRVIIQD